MPTSCGTDGACGVRYNDGAPRMAFGVGKHRRAFGETGGIVADNAAHAQDRHEDAATLDAIAFVGNALGPFFLQDPVKGAAGEAFAAFAALDVDAAAREWPFANTDEAACALRLMHDALIASGGAPDDAMTWEFRRLFVGPAAKAAPAWGSVYTDRDQVMFGKSTLDLREWMRAHGVVRLGDHRDPEDHIGLMLALMAWLAEHRPELLDEFLREHLLTWSGHFCDVVVAETSHPFYEGLARLTKSTLEGIRVARGLHVVYPRFYR